MHIRRAVVEDAQPISTLLTELGFPTAAAAMEVRLSHVLSDPTYLTLVAEADGQVIGLAGASLSRYYEKDGIYARLVVLVVSSSVRGRGIGTRLVEAIEHWSAEGGARDVVVTSGLHRPEAHRFYEGRGYSRTGYRFVKSV